MLDVSSTSTTTPSSSTRSVATIAFALKQWREKRVTVRTISDRTFCGRLQFYDHKRFELRCKNGITVLMSMRAVAEVRLSGPR